MVTNKLPIKIELPEHFLEEEERCDYLVSTDMKKIWAVEIDILFEIKRVCDKYNIRWCTEGGTTIGAIRHQGFIPWDDDIDILMLREDYDRFCEVAPKEMKHPYFYQDYKTDPYCLHGHVQIRNSDTTGILRAELGNSIPFNQGIFVDIFPVDNITPDEKIARKHVLKALSLKKKSNQQLSQEMTDFFIRVQKNVFIFFKNCVETYYRKIMVKNFRKHYYKESYKKFLSMMERWKNEETGVVTCMSLSYSPKKLWKKKWFEHTVMKKFEWFEIPVPCGYTDYLDKAYGDWHKFVMGGSMHSGVIFDTERPYTYYIG